MTVTVYGVEKREEYADQRVDVLFTTRELAKAYIAERVAAAHRYDEEHGGKAWRGYGAEWEIVAYRLLDAVPYIPPYFSSYDEIVV